MKVLIDNQVYENQKFGGISRYFNELRQGNSSVLKMDPFLRKAKNKNLSYKIYRKLRSSLLKEVPEQIKKYDFYNSQLRTLEYDLFHPTYYDNYFLKRLQKPFVITVHDMIHEIFPEYYLNSFDSINKRRLCEAADRIIAISHTTKKDLISIFEIPEEKIEVIYHATNFASVVPESPDMTFKNKDYLLFTGNRSTYKNFLTFLVAVAPILKESKHIELICTGHSFNEVEKRWIKDLGIVKKVHNYYCKNDSELAYLYSNAQCFVFPSLYEGFGFPLLEAFACNCPVVSSHGGSLKEIAGNAAVYFDPKNIPSIRNSISRVLSDKDLRNSLVDAGKERLKMFSWNKCREETNQFYSEVLKTL